MEVSSGLSQLKKGHIFSNKPRRRINCTDGVLRLRTFILLVVSFFLFSFYPFIISENKGTVVVPQRGRL